VIEYNCRMGDPETEVVLPRLKNDLVSLLLQCHKGTLNKAVIRTDRRAATTVFLVSGGYPGQYAKGHVITGLEAVQGSIPFHAGTRLSDNDIVTDGGRVIALTSYGKTAKTALARSNKNARMVQFKDKYFRRDIGKDIEV
jgi:phosphoribosylamine---glycine ligase